MSQGLQALSGYPLFVLYGVFAALYLPRGYNLGSLGGALVGALFAGATSIAALGAMSLTAGISGLAFDQVEAIANTYLPTVALAAAAGCLSGALDRRQRGAETVTSKTTTFAHAAVARPAPRPRS